MSDFQTYLQKTAQSIEDAREELNGRERTGPSVSWSEYPITAIQTEVRQAIMSVFDLTPDQLPDLEIEIPPEHIQADFAVAMFPLASVLRDSPQNIAENVVSYVYHSNEFQYLASAEAIQGYFNIYLNTLRTYQHVLRQVLMLGENYGVHPQFEEQRIFLEYSAPNIAKPMSIGHLRSTILGEVLGRLYERGGARVIRDNHLGDWGTQFGSLLYVYQESDLDLEKSEDPIEELKNLYVSFTERAKEDPELKERARKMFKHLEEGDSELIAMWQKIRQLSIDSFERVYEDLDVNFDLVVGESYYLPQARHVIEDVEEKGLAHRGENGELVVDSLEDFDTFLLEKGNGTTLYLTRDVAAIADRERVFDPDKILYVVGNEQALHFQQLFGLARVMDYVKSDTDVEHIGFGLVRTGGKKMSTRKGRLVTLEDVLEEAVNRARRIIEEKRVDLSDEEREEIARQVGYGAVIYHDLRHVRTKDVDFNWDQMLSLEGESAVYLQYTAVRIRSLLENLGNTDYALNMSADQLTLETSIEFRLAKHLSLYPWTLANALNRHTPHILCTYLETLASLFNTFYGSVSVRNTPDRSLRASRVVLILAVFQTLENGLDILNVPVPDKL